MIIIVVEFLGMRFIYCHSMAFIFSKKYLSFIFFICKFMATFENLILIFIIFFFSYKYFSGISFMNYIEAHA